jgi:long-subunit fatty acid transport protein
MQTRSLSRLLPLAALLLASAVPAVAQQIYRTTAVPFLLIEPDSRAAGMGNAGVALADNASAMFWNPAGLAQQRGAEVGLTHAQWLPALTSDLFYEYVAGRYHLDGIGTFGAHLTYLNLGEQEFRGPNNEDLGRFKSYELATGLAYARQLTRGFSLGVGSRLIYSKLADALQVDGQQRDVDPGVSFGFDLAGLYAFQPIDVDGVKLAPRLGFNLANMGPSINYGKGFGNDAIPTNLRFGGALGIEFDEFNRLNLAVDFNKTLVDYTEEVDAEGDTTFVPAPFYEALFSSWKSVRVATQANTEIDPDDPATFEDVGVLQQITLGMGLEYWYSDLFALRGGYYYEDPYNGNRQFLTFGAGIRYNLIGVDLSYIYGLEEESPLSGTIRFSILLNFLQ